MKGKTILITGGTRGIGKAIALRCAAEGANVVIAAKTVESTAKTPGTIHEAAAAVDAAGGQGMGVQVDVRDERSIEAAVAQTVERFGGLDAVINNAGAIRLEPTSRLQPKAYDLMFSINTRAVWMMAHYAHPHLKRFGGHFLTLSPPVDLQPKWFASHAAYTTSKFAMSMLTMGFAAEWKRDGITCAGLWPRTSIATAAVEMLGGDAMMGISRTPAIMADAAYAILTADPATVNGRCLLDEDYLRECGQTEFGHYAVDPTATLMTDLFVEPR